MNKAPILVEVVDKRFYLCTHMVIATLACHDYEGLGPPGAYLLSNRAADALSELTSDEALEGFIEACISPTEHALMTFFGRLLKPLISKADASLSNSGRFLKEVVKAGRKPNDAHRLAFEKIFDLTTPAVPLGINQVLPTKECTFP